MITLEDPKDDIWEKNPFLELISDFKKFKQDVGARKSSKVLAALFLIYDPKSPFRNQGMSDDEILEDVTLNYLTYKGFDWADYEDIKAVYLSKCISKLEKLLLTYERDLDELAVVMKNWKYTKENAKERAAVTDTYKTLLEDYIELSNKVEEEKKASTNRAKYTESLAEQLGMNG